MHEDMEGLFDRISKRMFGRTWGDSMREHVCVRCGKPAIEFRDKESSDYNDVTGYCQRCQDGFDDRMPHYTETIFDICPACHAGDMKEGSCSTCGARECS